MMSAPLLIIGGDSKTGVALKKRFPDALSTSRRASGEVVLDLADPAAGLATAPQCKTVIICAAMSGEVACRECPELAAQVNAHAPQMIAEHFRREGSDVIYLTSDAAGVDAGVYASTKLAGERAVKAAGGRVLRLGKLLFPQEQDLFKTWARSLAAGETVTAFTNRALAPICETHLQNGVELFLNCQDEEGCLLATRYVSYAQAASFIAQETGADAALIESVAAPQSMMPSCQPSRWFDAPDPMQALALHLQAELAGGRHV